MKVAGCWWNDKSIEVIEIDGEYLALYGWNGEEYVKCFYVTDEVSGIFYELAPGREGDCCAYPVYDGSGEIIDYRVCRMLNN